MMLYNHFDKDWPERGICDRLFQKSWTLQKNKSQHMYYFWWNLFRKTIRGCWDLRVDQHGTANPLECLPGSKTVLKESKIQTTSKNMKIKEIINAKSTTNQENQDNHLTFNLSYGSPWVPIRDFFEYFCLIIDAARTYFCSHVFVKICTCKLNALSTS